MLLQKYLTISGYYLMMEITSEQLMQDENKEKL